MSCKEELKKHIEDVIKYSISISLIERAIQSVKDNKSFIKLKELTKRYPSKRKLRYS